MKINVATLFPNIYDSFLSTSIVNKAIKNGLLNITFSNMLSLVDNKKRVDTPICGHGSGMLLGVDIIEKAYNDSIKNFADDKKIYKIFLSPHGKKLNQKNLHDLYDKLKDKNLLIYSGRYEGFDVRAEEEYADEIISIGDYVLMGGDLPAMVLIESLSRFIPGVIGKEESIKNDSFESEYLDCPHYALPDEWKDKKIPAVLKSGNHKEIYNWRKLQSIKRTIINNFEWWRSCDTSLKEREEVKKVIPPHYCALLHNDVMMPDGRVSECSVTSIDIHDIARSSATYGIKNYYIVTRLEAQKKLVSNFLSFWHHGDGNKVNQGRVFCLKNVSLLDELDSVIMDIENKEGKKPICIVTSSRRNVGHSNMITYKDQGKIWALDRPVLFIFGTSHGISPDVIEKIEYKLIPLEGTEEFNFLSVRSAAAIIFDRWLGINQV